MVRSAATTLEAYLAEADASRRPALERIDELCRRAFPGSRRVFRYGMPGFERNGALLASFANQRQCIALYVGEAALATFRSQLAGRSAGKGCVRFPRPDQMDFALIERILERAAAENSGR